MKKIVISILALTFVFVSATASFASTDTPTKGEEGMYDFDSGIYYVNGVPQISRTTKKVGGGTWKYDCGIEKTVSHYYHAGKKHSASVKNSRMKSAKRVTKKAGVWAKAWCYSTVSGNKVYWNTY